ncbi:zinc carboxypeptidase [Lacihabitans sp. LS3-19]|uniref:M14 family zinc carboxypeptidase n=1 Tax=Lacihabitans sp. LS3-19 TaxID=2487335 RepID=UPI0020CF3C75|nr:M14 family zinc carboxypeptidase [Lacihabitans sp. LS3-19]MCP9767788.1 zinc carboxypeptidase [Lacihabitans sp. LS3-19]
MKFKLFLLFAFLPFFVFSQVDLSYYLPTNVSYNKEIPTPKEFLGYEVGEQHVNPFEVYAYYREVAKHSDRIKIETYARSFENRELLLATVSSPKNLVKLNEIKAEHAKLSQSDISKSLKIEQMPIVVWMGYSVHGNEASGLNSSLLTIYYLAAAEGKEIDDLLNESIILVDPCINPDGGNRFSTWVNQNKSQTLVSDINAREFKETWPGGRTNHYWFDMNRDWLYQQLPESKGRLVKFYDWLPNILTDHHEMGSNSTFFFQPGIPERTHPMTPVKNIDLTVKFGKFQAAGLDSIGSYYYTKENYDDFYYGKGSTLPDVNGSIGILFEQASSRGHLQENVNGVISFPFTVRNQFTASLSTLKAGKSMRTELLNYMRDFYSEKSTDDIKAYVFGGGNDPVRVWEMVNVMRRNQIEVYKLGKNEGIGSKQFQKSDAFVVPMNQPKHRLVKSLFEQRTTFADSAFYDISAWTLPLCMNVPFAESKSNVSLGEKITEANFPSGSVVGESKYSYLFEWDGYFAARSAYELLDAGYILKYAMEPFKSVIDGKEKEFSYGTIQIQCGDKNPTSLLKKLAERDGTIFYAQSTGLTTSGINMGSEKFRRMQKPQALMIVGDGVDYNDAGEVWHLLDQRVSFPMSFADISQVNRIDLEKYTHIIINQGRYGELSEEKIKKYVAGGGTIVALGDGASWLSQKKIGSVSVKPQASNDGKGKRPFAMKTSYDGAMATSGAILEAKIDPSHPICYGYKQSTLPIFKVNNVVFEETGNPYNTPLIFTEKPLMAGYVHSKNIERFKSSPAVIAQTVGAGKIISFSDNPNFRAFWYGTNKLFLNALFFGNGISGGRFEED